MTTWRVAPLIGVPQDPFATRAVFCCHSQARSLTSPLIRAYPRTPLPASRGNSGLLNRFRPMESAKASSSNPLRASTSNANANSGIRLHRR